LDVGQALRNLERDLGVNINTMIENGAPHRSMLEAAIVDATSFEPDPTSWYVATWGTALSVMGFDPRNVPDAYAQPDAVTLASGPCTCLPWSASIRQPLRRPPDRTPPDRLIDMAFAASGTLGCCSPSCNDWNPCTADRCTCDGCTHSPRSCSDGSSCTTDSCSPSTGCTSEWTCMPIRTPCLWRRCSSGACITTYRDCDDGFACSEDSCDPASGCQHDWTCEPLFPECLTRRCTIGGGCEVVAKDCDDHNACTGPDTCDADVGCINEWLCDEPSDPCMQRGCDNGQCIEEPRDCNDGSACTRDWCDVAEGGCQHEDLCTDDGNPCTIESCKRGPDGESECVSGSACDDGNPCTTSTCSGSGSSFTCHHENRDGPCPDDGNPCTTDVCAGGICTHPAKCGECERCLFPSGDCCPVWGVSCDDELCCAGMNACNPGACICEDPTCTTTYCGTRFACDDFNVCTIDECERVECGVACAHEDEVDCADCETGWCMDGECEPQGCTVTLPSATVCPGGSVELALGITCEHPCGILDWEIEPGGFPPYLSVLPLSGSASCVDPQPIPIQVRVTDPEAPPTAGSPVPIPVTVTGHGANCSPSSTPRITIAECVDLSFDGVPADKETDPGGFLCLNDDDDNANDMPDKDETGAVAGEDDLEPLMISLACGLTGTVTLDPPPSGIKLFTAADRSTPASDLSWTETELPVTLYVEGVSPSGVLGDVELTATFTGEGGPCEDVVKLTVIQVDLDVEGVADNLEDNPPGLKVATNNDFDENKGAAAPVADYVDVSPLTFDGTAIATIGLVSLPASVLPEVDEVYEDSTIRLLQTGGSGSVRILAIRADPSPPFGDDWTEVPFGPNLRDDFFMSSGAYNSYDWYVEGLTPGQVELTLEFERDSAVCRDEVRANVVEYGIVEILYKTFIACNAVSTGSIPGVTDIFAGDDRNFGYALQSSRSFQSYRVSVNPTMVAGPMSNGVRGTKAAFGDTLGYNGEPANVTLCPPEQVCPSFCTQCITATATPECTLIATSGLSGNLAHVDESLAEVELALVGQNPCVSLAPPIDAHTVFQFRQVYDATSGVLDPTEWRLKPESEIGELHYHDGFPWHEVYLNGIEVYRFDACIGPGIPGQTWPGPDPDRLWAPAEISVFERPQYSDLAIWQSVPGQ
jgi:hypothetical protein